VFVFRPRKRHRFLTAKRKADRRQRAILRERESVRLDVRLASLIRGEWS
jgi:hypothetical protein